MKDTNKKLPSKKETITITVIFLITQFFYLATNFGNMPILRDTFAISGFPEFVLFFNKYYFNFDVIMSIIQIMICVHLFKTFISKGYPSLITLITNFWNVLICLGSAVILFIMNARNIPLQIQILFVIPILSIFTSSVALIDDTADIFRGSYETYVSRRTKETQKKFQRSAAKVAQLNSRINDEKYESEEYTILSQEDALLLHQQKIAEAAEHAYPKFNDH